MEMVDFKQMVYLPDENRYSPVDEVPPGVKTADISGTEVRDKYLAKGLQLPEWFSRPAVAEILNEANPPKFRQGVTIWFTGLSGSGKSTVAHATIERLAEFGRNCSLLDGDEIRTHLSKGLGFSKEDRDTNIRRVGYVAGLIAQHGGTTLCSVISPYRAIRDEARKMSKGNFVEVYCSTPIDVCEQRDVKGMYAKARAAVADGKPMGFTGVDDPYEPPLEPRGHARHQHALGPGVRRHASSTSCSSWAISCRTGISSSDPPVSTLRDVACAGDSAAHGAGRDAFGESPAGLAGGSRKPGRASALIVRSSKRTSTEWSDTPVSAARRTSVRSSGPSSTVRSTRKGLSPSAYDVVTFVPARSIRSLPDRDLASARRTLYLRSSGYPETRVDVNRSPSFGIIPRSMVKASFVAVLVSTQTDAATP